MNLLYVMGLLLLGTLLFLLYPLLRKQPAPESGAVPRVARCRATAFLIAVVLPFCALSLYAYVGSPQLPSKPFPARLKDPEYAMAKELQQLLDVLKTNPDASGYGRLGDGYSILHEYNKAVEAYQKSLELNPKDAARWSELGEATGMANDGMVTADARKAFVKALRLDDKLPRARFYLGLAEVQNNQPQKAIAIWRDLEVDSPADAPWFDMVRNQIALVSKKYSIDPANVKPAKPDLAVDVDGMSAFSQDQKDAIHGMVERLAARLEDNPDDAEGWAKLVRSYSVLGEKDKAKEAQAHLDQLQKQGKP